MNGDEKSYLKKQIIEYALQMARINALGYYIDEKSFHVLVPYNDRSRYAEHFLFKLNETSEKLIRLVASEINYDPES